jgi:two-component system, chemotaxis family, protein-glutamate methylesterase/glutaminase
MTGAVVRVVVVDDSPICRGALREVLEIDDDIRVVAEADDPASAVAAIARERPDLATVDIVMPGGGGLVAIERIMATHPVPLLVVTGAPAQSADEDLSFEAIARGALDLVVKPSVYGVAQGRALRARVRQLAALPVVRHVAGRMRELAIRPAPAVPAAAATHAMAQPAPRPISGARALLRARPVVGIAASAGGPAAVAAVLRGIFSDGAFGGCAAVVQHLSPDFVESFARFLRDTTRQRVMVVSEPTRAEPRAIYLAAADRHLIATPTGFEPSSDPPVRRFRPAADVLFESLARTWGSEGIGVVLSGLGDDGARGLRAIREAGGCTFAQDEASSAVYGMPRAAKELGGAAEILALADLGAAIVSAAARPGQERSGARPAPRDRRK